MMKSLTIPIEELLGFVNLTDPDSMRQLSDILEKTKAAPESVNPADYTAEAAVKLARRVAKRVRAAERRKARQSETPKKKSCLAGAPVFETIPDHSVDFPFTPRILGYIKDIRSTSGRFFDSVLGLFGSVKEQPQVKELIRRITDTRDRLNIYMSQLYAAQRCYYAADKRQRPASVTIEVAATAPAVCFPGNISIPVTIGADGSIIPITG